MMPQSLQFLPGGLWHFGVTSLLVSLVAFGIMKWVRRAHPVGQKAALVPCLVILLGLPLLFPAIQRAEIFKNSFAISVPNAVSSPAPELASKSSQETSTLGELANSSSNLSTDVGARYRPVEIIAIALAVIWIAGVLVVLMRHVSAHCALRKFECSLERCRDNEVIEIWNSVAGDAAVDTLLLVGPPGTSPVTFGIRIPRVVIPADLTTNLSSEEIRAVLAHEFSHIRNRDSLAGIAQTLVAAVYWWNPLARALLKRFSLVQEMVSDLAASRHVQAADYASALLRLAQRQISPPTIPDTYGVTNAFRHPLELRFKMLARQTDQTQTPPETMKQTLTIYAALLIPALLCSVVRSAVAENSPGAQANPGDAAKLTSPLGAGFDARSLRWFKDYGLDGESASMVSEDPDGDGFSNLEEYRGRTSPDDKAQRPPLYTKLYFIGREEDVTILRLSAIIDDQIQVVRLLPDKPRSWFKKIGESFPDSKSDPMNGRFTLISLEAKVDDKGKDISELLVSDKVYPVGSPFLMIKGQETERKTPTACFAYRKASGEPVIFSVNDGGVSTLPNHADLSFVLEKLTYTSATIAYMPPGSSEVKKMRIPVEVRSTN